MAGYSETLRELEKSVRERLRTVQLVCELEISCDDSYFVECHKALNTFLASESPVPIRRLSEECPAIFVLVLTVIGAQLGNGGELWEPIMHEQHDGLHLVGLDGTNSNKFGEQFRYSLERLGLPMFSHLQRRRNLGPILLHAGIPFQSSEEVWRKIHDFVIQGVSSGREVIQDLRGDTSQIRYFKKPAQSFITESGAFAVDLIQRMMNVVVATLEDSDISADVLASRHGLPLRMVETFTKADTASLDIHHSVPSANIYLELDTGMGPFCLLPPIRTRQQEYLWSVVGRTFRASGRAENPVQLEPMSTWSVEVMANGRRVRARKFSSLTPEGGWLFIESSQRLRLVQSVGGVEEGLYFLLAPKSQHIRVTRSGGDTDAVPSDAAGLGYHWSSYAIYKVDLVGATQLCIESADGNKTVLDVSPLPLRPHLEGVECQYVKDSNGLRLFSSPPRIVFTGHGGEISQFNLSIRTPEGEWKETPLANLAAVGDEIILDQFIEWETGSYRVEITGPLGSGLSEKFAVLLDGELAIEERLFLPMESVRSVLSYRKGRATELTMIEVDFKPFQDRLEKSLDKSVNIEARIPRIAFDFGGVGLPPDFSHSAPKVLAIEDLKDIQNHQLQIKTGKPAELEFIMREKDGEIFHRQPLTTAGPIGYGVVEVAFILDSIRLTGARETVIEILTQDNLSLTILTIQQTLDFQILDSIYRVPVDAVVGVLHVNVRVPLNSPDAYVSVQSLERVWEAPEFFSVPSLDEESEVRQVQCLNITPGSYSLGLSVGSTHRSIPSTRRNLVFGTNDERERYRGMIANDPQRLAEQIVNGQKAPRSINTTNEIEAVHRVTHFLLLNQRKLPTDSEVFKACIDFVAREGNTRIIAKWITQSGAEFVPTRDIENFVVRMFPLFVDDPILDTTMSEITHADEDEILAARLWTLSSVIGLTFTHRMRQPIVDELIASLGPLREPINYEILAELTWPALENEVNRATEYEALFSLGHGLRSFTYVWEQCWPNGRLDESVLGVLSDWTERGRKLMPHSADGAQLVLPVRIAEIAPTQLRQGRKPENLLVARFVHHLFRLFWLASRAETPLNVALDASQILGESYGFAKGLSDRALALSLLTARPRSK